ncbi:hypothetical protein [uncultured Campylobacter sp.]|uniref:hypothetical protein n=1 Tax=uncultured Campylobacter sp. TaxID=218934 RepID=UPI0026019D4A|nr:hypothetical protein [uncultured Campylobacter sp.]
MHAELDMSDVLPSAFQSSFIALAIDRISRGILCGAVIITTFKKRAPQPKSLFQLF